MESWCNYINIASKVEGVIIPRFKSSVTSELLKPLKIEYTPNGNEDEILLSSFETQFTDINEHYFIVTKRKIRDKYPAYTSLNFGKYMTFGNNPHTY